MKPKFSILRKIQICTDFQVQGVSTSQNMYLVIFNVRMITYYAKSRFAQRRIENIASLCIIHPYSSILPVIIFAKLPIFALKFAIFVNIAYLLYTKPRFFNLS